jgi:predicted nuclease of restriction endonuclease-like (RecB) superfamily
MRKFYLYYKDRDVSISQKSSAKFEKHIDSFLYERLALSRDKIGITKLSKEGQIVSNPADLLKDPYNVRIFLKRRTSTNN